MKQVRLRSVTYEPNQGHDRYMLLSKSHGTLTASPDVFHELAGGFINPVVIRRENTDDVPIAAAHG